MAETLQISAPDVFFLADCHFRDRRVPGESDRHERFIRFSENLPAGAVLFLLGDVFDFYFEYASVVDRRYFDVFYALRGCHDRGVELHFTGGNHDFWVGAFLEEEIGVRVHCGDLSLDVQGRSVRCSHGDLFLPGDHAYRALRKVLRNPVAIKLARTIHPDLMTMIARFVSGKSKERPQETQQIIASRVASLARARCFNWHNDAFIMGHVHYPLHRVFEGRDFIILGDWIQSFTYAHLRSGEISLKKFDG